MFDSDNMMPGSELLRDAFAFPKLQTACINTMHNALYTLSLNFILLGPVVRSPDKLSTG